MGIIDATVQQVRFQNGAEIKRFSNILFDADPGADDSAALSRAEELANNNQAQLTVVGLVEASDKEKNSADASTGGIAKILVALDYDPEDAHVDKLNGQILEMALSLALSDFAELHVVHAWLLSHESFMRSPRSGLSKEEVDEMLRTEENTRRQWLEALVNRHCAAQGDATVDYLKPQIHLSKGSASQLVPALSEELGAELIVMGTVGRTGISGFLIGNTAEDILHQIPCSVLAVKPAGFVSPVTLEG